MSLGKGNNYKPFIFTGIAGPTPSPTPTPPPETRQTVETMLSDWKEENFDEIQPLLTERFDFEGNQFIHSGNFKAYADKSELTITDEVFSGNSSVITVKAVQPDIDQMRIDYSKSITGDGPDDYQAAEDAYVKSALEKTDYPIMGITSLGLSSPQSKSSFAMII